MRDALGNEIVPGDYVAYAVRSGNSGKLLIGKVISTWEYGVKVIAGSVQFNAFTLNSKLSDWMEETRAIKVSDISDSYKSMFDDWIKDNAK